MFRFFLIFVIIYFAGESSSLSQIRFEKVYTSKDIKIIESVCRSSDEGYIFAGFIDTLPVSWYRAFYLKTDAAGNLIWAKVSKSSFTEQIYKVRPTNDGGIISVGSSQGYYANTSGIVVKISSAGTFEWQKVFENQINLVFTDVWQTSDSGYVVTGRIDVGAYYNLYVARLKADGQVAWCKEYRKVTGNKMLDANSIREIPGGYLVSGSCDKTSTDPIFFTRLDINGNVVWTKSFNDSLSTVSGPVLIDITKDGNCILSANMYDDKGNYNIADFKN